MFFGKSAAKVRQFSDMSKQYTENVTLKNWFRYSDPYNTKNGATHKRCSVFFFTDTINACPLCPLCPLTAFFEFVRLLYFADFHYGYKKSRTFALFLVVSLQQKKWKKVWKKLWKYSKSALSLSYICTRIFEKRPARVRASLLHHRCITAAKLLIPYNIIHL